MNVRLPIQELAWVLTWSVCTILIAWLIKKGFPKGLRAWLKLTLLFGLFLIGHIVQIAIGVSGLPNIVWAILFPALLIIVPLHYYDSARLAGLSVDNAQGYAAIWGTIHALTMLLYLWINVICFKKLGNSKNVNRDAPEPNTSDPTV